MMKTLILAMSAVFVAIIFAAVLRNVYILGYNKGGVEACQVIREKLNNQGHVVTINCETVK